MRHQSLFAVFSLSLYLAALGLGVWDVAASGSLDHEHQGQPCPIHHFLKQSDSVTATADGPVLPERTWTQADFPVESRVLRSVDRRVFRARAPPVASFS